MALTVFEALDKAIAEGGSELSGTKIAGSGKSAPALLEQLCSSGSLEASGGKTKKKYTVTPKGRKAWEHEASPERRQEIRELEEQQQRQSLVGFLTVVQKKKGKALTPAEQGRFPEPVRQQACAQHLVRAGTIANGYDLLSAGGALLQVEPIRQEMGQLRKLQKETVARWRELQKRLKEEIGELDGPGERPLRAASEDVSSRAESAVSAFDKALAELAAFTTLVTAAREFKAAVLEASKSEADRLTGLEVRLQQASKEQQELEAVNSQVSNRLNDVALRLSEIGAKTSPSPPQPTPAEPVPDVSLWEATRKAYQELEREAARGGGSVKIPDLTDFVRRFVPSVSRTDFHELLRKWQHEDRVILKVCNERHREQRANEGIESQRGLLFYVELR